MLCLHAVTDKNGHPLENEDESGRRLCEHWGTIFPVRVEGQRHHHYENILRYVQQAPDDIRWVIDKNEFDELMATKKESAPGPDGIPYSLYRCAGDWDLNSCSKFFNMCSKVALFLQTTIRKQEDHLPSRSAWEG